MYVLAGGSSQRFSWRWRLFIYWTVSCSLHDTEERELSEGGDPADSVPSIAASAAGGAYPRKPETARYCGAVMAAIPSPMQTSKRAQEHQVVDRTPAVNRLREQRATVFLLSRGYVDTSWPPRLKVHPAGCCPGLLKVTR